MGDSSSHQSFTELHVWKQGRIFKNEIKELADKLPQEEKFRLSDQIIRSSRSINGNISEGHGRYTFKDQIYFCVQARGSLSETYNHLIDAFDCKYISLEELDLFVEKIKLIEKLLNGYISYLRNSNNGK